jgi:chromosome segregation ATPase
MIDDLNILRALARETEARCHTARKYAEEAQRAQHWDGNLRDVGYEKALGRFLDAADEAERARRRLQAAEEAMREGAA